MIKCDKCGKEISYDNSWEWSEAGVSNYFCSKACLDKWLLAIRAKDAYKKDMDK